MKQAFTLSNPLSGSKGFNRNAFTLAEVLITIVVLGVIVALTVPVIASRGANSGMVLTKKAYATTEKIVAEIINDPLLYPDRTDEVPVYYGFDDTSKTTFLDAFKSKLNIVSEDASTFTTPDGIVWDLSAANGWTRGVETDQRPMLIDVNGDKAPNCRYNATTCKEPDQFRIYVQNNGRIWVKKDEDPEAVKHITAHSKLSK